MAGEDKFKMFVPIDIIKGGEMVDKAGKKRKLVFKGVASTDSKDLDGEELIPAGFEYSPFLKSGFINWNHQTSKDPMAIIGEPTEAFVKGNEFHIGGFLYEDSPLARKVWDLQETLEKCSPSRRLGFSIEGSALQRDPKNKKKVTKALILNVAIAPTPKNADTSMSLVKAFEYDTVSESNDLLVDIVNDGKRFLMNKSFHIEVIDERSILLPDSEFVDNMLVVADSLEKGLVSDADSIKAHMSGFRQIFDGAYWVREPEN